MKQKKRSKPILQWILLISILLVSTFSLKLSLDLPNGTKIIEFDHRSAEEYNSKPYIKQMFELEIKYVHCLQMKGVSKEHFDNCAGEEYSKIIDDHLHIYFEFMKEIENYMKDQKIILCKSHYSSICPDLDMFMREQLPAADLRKETFVQVFKDMDLSAEFHNKEYYNYLRYLFKAIDEIIEMRKMSISLMMMAAGHCRGYTDHLKFLHLDYNPHDMSEIKKLMSSIDRPSSPEYIKKLEEGIAFVKQGHEISQIPSEPVWGNKSDLEEDENSLHNVDHQTNDSSNSHAQTLFLNPDSGTIRNDDFHSSVLREKQYMDLMKNLNARAQLDEHPGLFSHDTKLNQYGLN